MAYRTLEELCKGNNFLAGPVMKPGTITKSKRLIILLALTASVICLFSYTKVYSFMSSHLHKTDTVCITQPTFDFKTSLPVSKVHMCSYKYLSPGNTEEWGRLMDSITWPETPPLPKPFSLNLTTSASKSTFHVVPQRESRHVGDKLTERRRLSHCQAPQPAAGAGVVGQVEDHLNGTFTALFPLLWNGTAHVEVWISQATTKCNVCLDPHNASLCNFTDLNTGEQWFCYKPKKLNCDTRVSHFKGDFNQKISKEEKTLFQIPLVALRGETVVILPKAGESKQVSPRPTGFYFNNRWRPLSGPAVHQFISASAITSCLKGKQLHLFGDSTIRQYYAHITQNVPNLQKFDKHSSSQSGPFLATDYNNDIVVTFHCHGPPLRFAEVPVSQLRYVANELDKVTGGPNTVIVIGVWSHFSSFPLEVYYQRLVTIRKAVERLLNRAPGTKLDKLLRAVFKDTRVVLLDAWEMVQAHSLPHSLHPPPEIIKLMTDQVLSHTCPGMGA
ncbi:hypothetical protein WMY93_013795 [Mugilogobius chulae]|uniref:NXPE C-terminal domain-containing protein n=1 Tax=Mugilogobius chulae TaxID=88201 RepID=A0AAW0PCB7_9GOBI